VSGKQNISNFGHDLLVSLVKTQPSPAWLEIMFDRYVVGEKLLVTQYTTVPHFKADIAKVGTSDGGFFRQFAKL